ncbi:MAG: hypothetical protein ABFS19_09310 [Thermodesulfobacteriota bacterium]
MPTVLPTEKLKKALTSFCELLEKHPQKSRLELLHEVERLHDLSPLECDFLDKHFDEKKNS